MGKFIDLTGQVFGKLTVLSYAGKDKWGKNLLLCQCSCANQKQIMTLGYSLRSGHTKSCGCLQRNTACQIGKNNITHGASKKNRITKEYRSWQHMKARCYDLNDNQYHNYGYRGIKVCDRWLNSYQNFIKDMGEVPGKEYSIDRINNSGNYEPSNCRWATPTEQASNKRNSIRIDNQTLKQVCEEKDLPYHSIYARIKKLNWSIKDAINIPIGQKR